MPSFGRIAVTSLHPLVSSSSLEPLSEDGWVQGPLPLGLPPDESSGRAPTADAKGRSEFLLEHASTVLETRWHRWALDSDGVAERGLWAVELVKYPDSGVRGSSQRYVAIAHGTIDSASASWPVDAIGFHEFNDVRKALGSLGSTDGLECATSKGRESSFHIRFVTPSVQQDTFGPLEPDLLDVSAVNAWCWMLASGTVGEFGPPYSPGAIDRMGVRTYPVSAEVFATEVDPHVIPLSADWSALVLRDGAAFVAQRPDQRSVVDDTSETWAVGAQCQTPVDEFFDHAELYVRTIYTDAFVLAEMQRWALADVEQRSNCADTSGANAVRDARSSQQQLMEFKRRLWWKTVSRGGPADKLLASYQQQHQLDEHLRQCESDIGDLAGMARATVETRLASALALLTVVGVPVGVALTIGQLMAPSVQPRSTDRGGVR